MEETEKTHPTIPVTRECLQPTDTEDLVPVPNQPSATLEACFNPWAILKRRRGVSLNIFHLPLKPTY